MEIFNEFASSMDIYDVAELTGGGAGLSKQSIESPKILLEPGSLSQPIGHRVIQPRPGSHCDCFYCFNYRNSHFLSYTDRQFVIVRVFLAVVIFRQKKISKGEYSIQ